MRRLPPTVVRRPAAQLMMWLMKWQVERLAAARLVAAAAALQPLMMPPLVAWLAERRPWQRMSLFLQAAHASRTLAAPPSPPPQPAPAIRVSCLPRRAAAPLVAEQARR